jgi:cell division topological specificity factor
VKLLQKWFNASGPAEQTSKHIAKERLKVALTYDRSGLARDTIEQLRDEIIQLIAKHLSIRAGDIRINVERSAEHDVLVASIPLQQMQRPRAPATQARQPPVQTPQPRKGSKRRRRRSHSAS